MLRSQWRLLLALCLLEVAAGSSPPSGTKPGRSMSAPVLDSLLQGKPLGVLRFVNRRLLAKHLGRDERCRSTSQGHAQHSGSRCSVTHTGRWQGADRSRAAGSRAAAQGGLLLLEALPVLAAQTIAAVVVDQADFMLVLAIRFRIPVLALSITADEIVAAIVGVSALASVLATPDRRRYP